MSKAFVGDLNLNVGKLNSNTSTFTPNSSDQVLKLLEVHPGDAKTGYLLCEKDNGNQVKVFIEEATYNRAAASANTPAKTGKFHGGMIETVMKKEFEKQIQDAEKAKGVKMVGFENLTYTKKETVNGQKINCYTTTFVVNIISPFAHKLIRNKPVRVAMRHADKDNKESPLTPMWIEVYDPNLVKLDSKTIKSIAKELDERNNPPEGEYPLGLGIQLFAIGKNPDKKSEDAPDLAWFNRTPPVYQLPRTEDGQYPKLTGEMFKKHAEQYIEFVENDEELKKLGAEVYAYRFDVYRPTKTPPKGWGEVAHTGHPLYRAYNTKGLVAMGDETIYFGSHGGEFILQISDDKDEVVVGDDGKKHMVELKLNFINKMMYNKPIKDLAAFILVDGQKVSTPQELFVPFAKKDGSTATTTVDDEVPQPVAEQVENEHPQSKEEKPEITADDDIPF